MKPRHAFSLFVIASLLFTACSKETNQEVEEAADAVAAESKDNFEKTKDQVSEMAEKAKTQVGETAEQVKVKTKEVVAEVSEEVKEAKDVAVEKIEVIVKETGAGAAELKAKADSKLKGLFNQQDEAEAVEADATSDNE